ncbi:MAG: STAS domain-containing protein [Sulfuricella sp.]|nr:STAS domain-containing protein [Sulfuricella sp.]
MKLHREEREGYCSIAIEGDMTIYTAPELKQELLNCLAEHRGIEVSLDGVSDMDSAGFQVLYLLKREATASGKKASFIGPSPAVVDVLEVFKMAPYFEDSRSIRAAQVH